MKNKITEPKWKTAPISPTCEVGIISDSNHMTECGKPTVAAYQAWGCGWMALCARHAIKHPDATSTDKLIAKGEYWG